MLFSTEKYIFFQSRNPGIWDPGITIHISDILAAKIFFVSEARNI